MHSCAFYKIPLDSVTVFHDELDLPLSKIRIKRGGGAGGHNGLKSLDSHIGKDYQRVRIGIDHPGDKDRVSDYVLSDFDTDERYTADEIITDLSRHIDLLLAGDDTEFMNKLSLVRTISDIMIFKTKRNNDVALTDEEQKAYDIILQHVASKDKEERKKDEKAIKIFGKKGTVDAYTQPTTLWGVPGKTVFSQLSFGVYKYPHHPEYCDHHSDVHLYPSGILALLLQKTA